MVRSTTLHITRSSLLRDYTSLVPDFLR